jgi:hypothetical protein
MKVAGFVVPDQSSGHRATAPHFVVIVRRGPPVPSCRNNACATVFVSMVKRPTYRQQRKSGIWPLVSQFALWLLTRPFVWAYRIADLAFDFDKRGAASNLKRLSEEVEFDCGPLFAKYGGRIVPELSSGSPSLDYATVVVEVRSLQLRATLERGYTDWEITAPASPHPWDSLEQVCRRFARNSVRSSSTFQLLVDHLPEIERDYADPAGPSSSEEPFW